MSEDLVESSADLDKTELLLAMRHDCVSFFAFYLGEELTLTVPDFHISIWNELLLMVEQANQRGTIKVLRKLFAVPRDHAKSTLAKLATILFLLYTPLKFCLYVSKTNGHAKNAIRDIVLWLSSSQHRELHGPVQTVKSSETDSLWIYNLTIRTPGESQPKIKTVLFKALGSDQQIRGMLVLNTRPQIVIIDDIEDLDNTTTELQPKLDEWFMGSLRKSFAKFAVVIFLGNMIRKTTLLARLSKDPTWNPTVFGSLVRGPGGELRPLWPERWTVESLLEEYAEFRRVGTGHVWEAEMMNLTQDEILLQDLGASVRVSRPLPEDIEAGCLVLDPAFGLKNWNDDSAITVHVRIKGIGIPCVVDSWRGKGTEERLLDELLTLSYYWGISTWCIEADAGQKLFIPIFNLLMKDRKINTEVFTILPVQSSRNAKTSRILSMRNIVGGGSYGVADSEEGIMDALAQFDPNSGAHDDLADSASYGPIVWQFHNETITANGIKQVAMLVNQSEEPDGPRDIFMDAPF